MLRVVNVAMRGITLVCKFLLVFFLAKYMTPAEMGLYGLLTGSIGYALYLLGFEFYTYSTREMIRSGHESWSGILKGQLFFTLFMYLLSIPILSGLFFFKLLPVNLALWFFILLTLEHFSQEFNRIFVAVGNQLLASVVLFLRSGIWVFFVLALMYRNEELRRLNVVLLFWVLGGILACLLSTILIVRMKLPGWEQPVNWSWVRQGIKVAVPFLISTLAIRGVFTLDRFFLEHYSGLKQVGVYVLFVGISNALISFMDSGLFVFVYPELIRAHEACNPERFKGLLWRLALQVAFFCIVFSIISLVVIEPLLKFLGRPVYLESQWMFPWVLFATSLFCMGAVPQYGLYAQGKDRPIVIANVLSFFAFIIGTTITSIWSRDIAVLIGLCISMLVGTGWCTCMFFKLSPKTYFSKSSSL